MLEQSIHTITFLPVEIRTETVSPKDIGYSEQRCSSKCWRKTAISESRTTKTSKTTSDSALPELDELANQTTNKNQKEPTKTKATEMARQSKEAERPKTAKNKSLEETIKE